MATATVQRRPAKRKRTPEELEQIAREALARVEAGTSWSNYPAIIAGFTAKGIPEAAIEPRVNVFTYNAWKAKGRQVRRGEHGVRVCTWTDFSVVERDQSTGEEKRTSGRRPVSATVFHISQTDPIAPSAGRAA